MCVRYACNRIPLRQVPAPTALCFNRLFPKGGNDNVLKHEPDASRIPRTTCRCVESDPHPIAGGEIGRPNEGDDTGRVGGTDVDTLTDAEPGLGGGQLGGTVYEEEQKKNEVT